MNGLETCAAPLTTSPRHAVPSGAVDTHSHIFGPFENFPPKAASAYALPAALPDIHAAFRETLGMAFGVLTQPAPYGDDPSAMLEAISASRGSLRGVAVADRHVSDATLLEWRRGGIVGLRFVEKRAPDGNRYPGSVGFDELSELAPRMRAIGLHAQLWADASDLAMALPILLVLRIPLVLDHLGMPPLARGIADPNFCAILAALESGQVWIKHTLCRFFDAAPSFERVRPFHDALLAVRPDRMVWGSDWPYVRLDPAPDAGRMLDILADWTDTQQWIAILRDNPHQLYGLSEKA